MAADANAPIANPKAFGTEGPGHTGTAASSPARPAIGIERPVTPRGATASLRS
jgi:hypothetical protein